MNPSKPEDLLQLVLGELDSSEIVRSGPSGEIDVLRLLVDLAVSGTKPLGDRDRQSLALLCRKISVAKQVSRAYREDWKRVADPEPLGGRGWCLLIAVLLTRARITAAEESDLAHAVKYLNAALEGLDLAGELEETPHLAGLRACAGRILDRLAENLTATIGAPAP